MPPVNNDSDPHRMGADARSAPGVTAALARGDDTRGGRGQVSGR